MRRSKAYRISKSNRVALRLGLILSGTASEPSSHIYDAMIDCEVARKCGVILADGSMKLVRGRPAVMPAVMSKLEDY